MIHKFISRVMLLVALFAATSCETGFLDEKMTTSLGGDQAYASVSNYEMALIGVYDMLSARSHPTLGSEVTNYLTNYNGGILLLNELATDEMCAIKAGASKQLMLEELDKCRPTALNGIVKSVYAGQYEMINRANDLLYNAENSFHGENSTINQFVAEAKFLRALCYYNLTTLFGGVVVTELPGSERVGVDLPRSTTETAYNLIFKDLEEAYNVLPESYADVNQMGRATKTAAAALLARASLTAATMGKYAPITDELALEGGINSYKWAADRFTELITQAKTYAGKVINEGYTGEASLLSMPYEESFYPYENTAEIIFDAQFKSNLSQEEGGWVGYMTGAGSWNWVLPTSNIKNTYIPCGYDKIALDFPTNATKANCDMRKRKNITNFNFKGDGSLWPPVAANYTYNLGKFSMESKTPDYPKQKTPINYIILRLAESYLIYAEADAELNGAPTEASFRMINYVRRRAADANILPDLTAENLTDPAVVKPIQGIQPANKLEEFRIALMQERMLEFVGESLRRVDLIRSGWMAEYLENDNVLDFDESYYIEAKTGKKVYSPYMYKRRQFEPYFMFLPVPSREITLTNGVIVQNYGY